MRLVHFHCWIDSVNTKKINLFNAYKEGFTTMILNPKAILFYISILSQFINHQNNESVQGAILRLVHFHCSDGL